VTEKTTEECPACGAVPDGNGVVWHVNPTNDQRRRAAEEGVPVGVVQEREWREKRRAAARG
jgi:hypothetical protein